MRITVEIDAKTLKALLALTGETKKSPAISKAVREFIRGSQLKHFGDMIRRSEFDFPLTNEELEAEDR